MQQDETQFLLKEVPVHSEKGYPPRTLDVQVHPLLALVRHRSIDS